MNFKYNLARLGFTLAEVLITLAILGVVAAITVPTMIANSRQVEKVSRLKKTHSTLSNLVLRSNADNGPMTSWPVGSEIGDVRKDYWEVYLRPYFSNVKLCNDVYACGYKYSLSQSKWQDASWGIMTNSTRLLFLLGDGTVIFYPISTTNSAGQPAYVESIYADINGANEPNTFCKDVFPFKRNYKRNTIEPTGCTLEMLKKK